MKMYRYKVTLRHKWKRCTYERDVEARNREQAQVFAIHDVMATAQGFPSDYSLVSIERI